MIVVRGVPFPLPPGPGIGTIQLAGENKKKHFVSEHMIFKRVHFLIFVQYMPFTIIISTFKKGMRRKVLFFTVYICLNELRVTLSFI